MTPRQLACWRRIRAIRCGSTHISGHVPISQNAVDRQTERKLLMLQRARWIEGLTVVAGFAALAVVCTWPLAAQIGTALPGDLGDPLFSAWVLGWVSDRLRDGLRGFWDAPIFFPARGTLALSEHYFGVALLVAPVYWLSGNAVATYNAGVLVAYTLAGAGMYLLARSLTGSRPAAAVAGVVFAFAPYRADHLSHLQVLSSGWMPISLWGLHRFLSVGSVGALAAFAGAFAMQALSNGYFLYFLGFAAALVVLFHLDAVRARWRVVVPQLAAAAAAILLVLSPFVWAYVRSRAETGFARTYSDLINFSADAASYLVPAGIVRSYGWLPDRWLQGPQIPERQLFPGLVALTLAGLALWKNGSTKRKTVRLYAAIALLGFVLSLGPEPSFWGSRLGQVGPYLAFARVVPGMNGLRAPARSSILVFLSLSVLAAIGAARLFERLESATTSDGGDRARPRGRGRGLDRTRSNGALRSTRSTGGSCRLHVACSPAAGWYARAPDTLLVAAPDAHLPVRDVAARSSDCEWLQRVRLGAPELSWWSRIAAERSGPDQSHAAHVEHAGDTVRHQSPAGLRRTGGRPGDAGGHDRERSGPQCL